MKFKEYELKDHLGNVRATFNDLKGGSISNGFYLNNVETFNYYPFGMLEPTTSSYDGYRFGYNGMERDDEVKEKRGTLGSGKGNSYDYGARFYDPRGVRWWKRDNFENKYPSLSPYSYSANNPILFIDPDGNEVEIATDDLTNDNRRKVDIAIQNNPRLYNYLHNLTLNAHKNYYPHKPGEEVSEYANKPKFIIKVAPLNDNNMVNHRQIGSGNTIRFRAARTNGQYNMYPIQPLFTGDARDALIKRIKDKPTTYFEDINDPKEEELNRLETEINDMGGVVFQGADITIDPGAPDFGLTLGHEMGGLEYEVKNPVRSYIFQNILPAVNPKFDDGGGHRYDTDPHKEGSKQGENEYKENKNKIEE